MTQRNPIAPGQGAHTARIANLHRLCDEDYAEAQSRRQAQDHRDDAHLIADASEAAGGGERS